MIFRLITLSQFILFFSIQSVFCQEETLTESKERIERAPIKNDQTFVFKFDPTRTVLFEGKISDHSRSVVSELGLGFEKKTGNRFSFELELGATRFDYAFEPIGAKDIPDDDYYQTLHYNIESKVGGYSSLAFRCYPLTSALRGFYISPKFRYRLLMNEVIPRVSDLPDSRTESHKEFFYMLNIGYQIWLSNHYSFDFYVGAGMRSKIDNFQHCYWSYNPKTDSSILNWVSSSEKSILPNIHLGIKIGFGK